MEIKLIASTGRASGQAVEIRAAKFFIGRHDNCQLRPDIEGLAGVHVLIEHREDRLYLRDFGSDAGTGINERVFHLRETEIFDGDLIQVGPMVLTLSVKPKGEDTHYTLRDVAEGWPFLNGAEARTLASKHEVVAEPVRPPVVHEPTFISHAPEMPSRLAAFLARTPAPVAAGATLIEAERQTSGRADVDSVPRRPLSRPIVTRPRGHRAIACHQVGDVMVITLLSPDLNEEETVSPVRYELRSLLDEDDIPARTVIDLGNTKFLSSRAVGVLLAHYQALDRQGNSMRVCQVSKEIQPVIDQMRLSKLVDIYPTLEEAIEDPWD